MLTAKIKSVEKARVVSTGEEYLDVAIEIKEGKTKELYKRGYPVDTPTKEIRKDLKKLIATRKAEAEQAKAQKEQDEKDTKTKKTMTELEGLEVTEK